MACSDYAAKPRKIEIGIRTQAISIIGSVLLWCASVAVLAFSPDGKTFEGVNLFWAVVFLFSPLFALVLTAFLLLSYRRERSDGRWVRAALIATFLPCLVFFWLASLFF
jgi:uncharacterized membrane protein YozB (DUF420 family)